MNQQMTNETNDSERKSGHCTIKGRTASAKYKRVHYRRNV